MRRSGHLERRLYRDYFKGLKLDRAASLSPKNLLPVPFPGVVHVEAYRHVAERAALGIPAPPLSAQQTAEVIELLKNPPAGEEQFPVDLLTHRVPAGVDDAAKVKASYLAALAFGSEIGTGRAAEMGILFRKGDALQRLQDTTIVAVDKTGTLTKGKPELTDLVVVLGFEKSEVLAKSCRCRSKIRASDCQSHSLSGRRGKH